MHNERALHFGITESTRKTKHISYNHSNLTLSFLEDFFLRLLLLSRSESDEPSLSELESESESEESLSSPRCAFFECFFLDLPVPENIIPSQRVSISIGPKPKSKSKKTNGIQ